MPTDTIQVTEEAIVAILDTLAAVVTITGQANTNIVKWESLADKPQPVVPKIAYLFVVASELAADGDTRDALFQFTATAPKDSQVNELLGVVESALTQNAFLALATPLDAWVERRIRRGTNLDLTLRVSVPLAQAA